MKSSLPERPARSAANSFPNSWRAATRSSARSARPPRPAHCALGAEPVIVDTLDPDPVAVDIAPVLVPVTATCVALLFVGAVIMRLRRGEKATIVGDLVYLAMAVFVAWGRFGPRVLYRLTQRGVWPPCPCGVADSRSMQP
jgi:DoxX-like family